MKAEVAAKKSVTAAARHVRLPTFSIVSVHLEKRLPEGSNAFKPSTRNEEEEAAEEAAVAQTGSATAAVEETAASMATNDLDFDAGSTISCFK